MIPWEKEIDERVAALHWHRSEGHWTGITLMAEETPDLPEPGGSNSEICIYWEI
jgi:hypothetical protein